MMLGYYTLINYINEAIAYIGSVISMRKANMKHPFGFGKQESILHILVGIIFIITTLQRRFLRGIIPKSIRIGASIVPTCA